MSTAGRLRPSVRVDFSAEHVLICFGPWETRLPRPWVDERPAVGSLLGGRSGLRDGLADAEVSAVAQLLAAQGCFVPDPVEAPISLAGVRALFEPIKLEWYSAYYEHPLWSALRSGSATRAELVAWVIHNYHVSRAAGIVAARMATSHRRWRQFFEIDALEEFWHCDAYYFIDAPDLRVPGSDVRAYVPLPASLAFEQLCLQTAEKDSLAHLLIAFFQEASIIFRADSETFYDSVEQAYAVTGFFQRWRQHIQIDVDHGHADGLRHLFDTDWHVSADQLAAGLRSAWLAFYFLRASLDDVRAEAGPAIALRRPVDRDRGLAPFGVVPPLDLTSVGALAAWYAARRRPPSDDSALTADLMPLVRASALRALGCSRDHDELMLAGGIARALDGARDGRAAEHPWTIAIGNFLAEAASDSRRWHAVVTFLAARCAMPDEIGRLLRSYERRADLRCSSYELDRLATAIHQLDELVERRLNSSDIIPPSLTDWILP